MSQKGYSLVEILTVVAIILVGAAVSAPMLRAYAVDAHLLGVGREFKQRFRLARSIATRQNVYTAIRFESRAGAVYYSLYSDGNFNGVAAAEIAAGIDKRIAGPFLLTSRAPDVRVAIDPGTPAIPPDRGSLSGDPIRFGRADMLSFSPLGTATPGTFYLSGVGAQAAVRVTPGTARVRLLICRGGRWRERS
jgi:prepilin-type N-terminal cleavage/methylation domain-containing protein